LLRLRRRRPEVFVGPAAGFLPLATTSGAVVAFARTHDGEAQVVTLVTRRYRRLIEEGTDPDGLVHLPAGQWRSVLTSATYPGGPHALAQDRKSTRLNSSHVSISYAVFCLKK